METVGSRAVNEMGVLVWLPQKHVLKQRFEDKLFIWRVTLGSIGREREKVDRKIKNFKKNMLSNSYH